MERDEFMREYLKIAGVMLGILVGLSPFCVSAAVENTSYVTVQKEEELNVEAACYGELEYEIVGGCVSITGYTGTGGPVKIPGSIGGYPVASIGDYAFYYCSGITSVELPEGLISIGNSSFRFCTSLTEVKIPDGVTTIYGGAFEDCGNLVRIELPDSLSYIGEYAFEICPYYYVELTGMQPVGLKDIYFQGTRSQWNSISIAENNSWMLAADLHCTDDIEITAQPQDASGAYRDTVRFTVTATGEGIHYQWQVTEDGNSWYDLGGAFPGYASETLAVACSKSADGYLYRCRVWNGSNSVYSDSVRLTVISPEGVTITRHPQDFTGAKTVTAKFRAAGSGEGVTYRWQCSEAPGKPWEDLGPSTVGYNSEELQVAFIDKREGFRYRFVVTDRDHQSAVSNAAKIIIGTETQHSFEETTSVKASPGNNGKIVKTCTFCGCQEITITYAPYAIQLSKGSFVYDGKAKKPGVIVTTKNGADIDSKNYKITYTNNRNIGKGTVKVTFQGQYYEGSMTKTFKIEAKVGTKHKVGGLIYEIQKIGDKEQTVTLTGTSDQKLKKLKVPDSAKIGGQTFKVTQIADSAFKNCKELKSVTVGANVEIIGKKAFYGCKKLSTVTIKSKKLSKVEKKAFYGVKAGCRFKVPSGKKTKYKSLIKNSGVKKILISEI